jgi:RNA ligase (TIGR02306 family)
MKLRKALSQGLLMPMSMLTDDESESLAMTGGRETDLTAFFNVEKYEPVLPMGGQQKGTFPTDLIPKTDQERVQNMHKDVEGFDSFDFEITEKLDGTSCTMFHVMRPVDEQETIEGRVTAVPVFKPHIGVCSRNWEMEKDDTSVYARVFQELDMHTKLRELNRNIAIQGEIIGPGIQKNLYKLEAATFYVFDIYDIDEKRYLCSMERVALANQLGLLHVPILSAIHTFGDVISPIQQGDEGCALNLDIILAAADGKSELHKNAKREGLVFKHHSNAELSFKAISNKWLLRHNQ